MAMRVRRAREDTAKISSLTKKGAALDLIDRMWTDVISESHMGFQKFHYPRYVTIDAYVITPPGDPSNIYSTNTAPPFPPYEIG